jgi:hypothetical protein
MSTRHTGTLLDTFDGHGHTRTCLLYTGDKKIGSDTYMSGVGLGRLSLNSDSDRLDDWRLVAGRNAQAGYG